ncbi:DUF3168 domain-containing protein [Sphingomonas sp. A2-49]|uniref:DUF3168 domain-containing protein n=1 Tax=Sphingomonas sp. A2-49 TaxID=1391375 RepID=UPI0021CF1130|nr:DUF3168 domain-containing protein [Sphingomonas sp. A2-49]MCU6455865.1 DUF3168 domain-containing protein [Sphingomonas sp. A2-49]
MSAGGIVQAAVIAHLAPLGRVFDAVPARAAMPYLVVEDPVLAAGDAVGLAGRTGTIAITCIDAGVSPVRVRALLAAVEAAMATLPPQPGGGWRITSARLVRSQIALGKGERWVATSTFAVRMYRSN